FPRAAAEPPRRFRFCGVTLLPLFPQKSLPYPLVRSHYIPETYVHHANEKNPNDSSFGSSFN
ncbi:hypothetical protein, partial [Priestia megaterium]